MLTEKSKKKLLFAWYVYTKYKVEAEKVYWSCEKGRTCSGTAHKAIGADDDDLVYP